jgi:hypothetical protein
MRAAADQFAGQLPPSSWSVLLSFVRPSSASLLPDQIAREGRPPAEWLNIAAGRPSVAKLGRYSVTRRPLLTWLGLFLSDKYHLICCQFYKKRKKWSASSISFVSFHLSFFCKWFLFQCHTLYSLIKLFWKWFFGVLVKDFYTSLLCMDWSCILVRIMQKRYF